MVEMSVMPERQIVLERQIVPDHEFICTSVHLPYFIVAI